MRYFIVIVPRRIRTMRTDEENQQNVDVTPPPSIWRLGGLKWRVLALRVWDELAYGHILVHSAALAFYFLFALFPLLIFLVNLTGFFVGRGTEMRSSLLAYIRRLAPASAFTLIHDLIDEIATGAGGGKLLLGLLAALWFGSLGVAALSESLNAMYGVRESRSWWRVRAAAAGLTVVLMIVTFTALLLLVYGHEAGETLAGQLGLGGQFALLWAIVRVPLAVAFVLVAFAVVYYFTPDLKDQKWYWITPGSLVGVMLWLAASTILSTYLRYADTYSVTYGSLAGVMVMMLWFYVTGASILLGGKINSEIEHAAARAGVPGAKLHGERDPKEHEVVSDY